MNLYEKLILIFLALSVLISYYIVFVKLMPSSKPYNKHEFWFGMNSKFINFIIVFQILAALGFLISVINWFIKPPTDGILSHNNILFIILSVFLIGSIGWPFLVYFKKHIWVVISLILVAIASIVLLAGSVEDKNPRLHIMISMLFLCLITVLVDGVMWNATYIKSLLK